MDKKIIIFILMMSLVLSSCVNTKTLESDILLEKDPLIETLGVNYTDIDKINYVYELVSNLRSIAFHNANTYKYNGGIVAFSNLAFEFLEDGYEVYNGNWEQAILNANLNIETINALANDFFIDLDSIYQDVDKSTDVETLIDMEKKCITLAIELIEIRKESYVLNANSNWTEYFELVYNSYYPDEEKIFLEMERSGYLEDIIKTEEISLRLANKTQELIDYASDMHEFSKWVYEDILTNLKMIGFSKEQIGDTIDEYEIFLDVIRKIDVFDVQLILEEYESAQKSKTEDLTECKSKPDSSNDNNTEFSDESITETSEIHLEDNIPEDKYSEQTNNMETDQYGLPKSKTVTAVVEIYENEYELELFTSKLGYYIYFDDSYFNIVEYEEMDTFLYKDSTMDVGFAIHATNGTAEDVEDFLNYLLYDFIDKDNSATYPVLVESPVNGYFIEELFSDGAKEIRHYVVAEDDKLFYIRVVLDTNFMEGIPDILDMHIREFGIL